jgi:hypothetical protein
MKICIQIDESLGEDEEKNTSYSNVIFGFILNYTTT